MALGADIYFHLFLCGAGLKCLTAYAANNAFAVLGMDVFLHGVSPLSRMQWRLTQGLVYHMPPLNARLFSFFLKFFLRFRGFILQYWKNRVIILSQWGAVDIIGKETVL